MVAAYPLMYFLRAALSSLHKPTSKQGLVQKVAPEGQHVQSLHVCAITLSFVSLRSLLGLVFGFFPLVINALVLNSASLFKGQIKVLFLENQSQRIEHQ